MLHFQGRKRNPESTEHSSVDFRLSDPSCSNCLKCPLIPCGVQT